MQLKNHIRRYTRKINSPGEVVVHTRIDRQGNILSLYLRQSSGDETLDGEVLTQVERASPLPPPPTTIPGGILEFDLTVSFFGG
jgi:periplasmic protein TonB